jgi:hypothetical protein
LDSGLGKLLAGWGKTGLGKFGLATLLAGFSAAGFAVTVEFAVFSDFFNQLKNHDPPRFFIYIHTILN